MGSSSASRNSTIQSRLPNAPPRWTSSRAAGWKSAPGRSATWNELGGFRANPDETKKTWDEFVRCLPKMWTQERFGYQGRSWSMPERAIIPKPYQKPHPPMWVAVTSPGTEIDAAERGLGSLGLTFGSVKEQEEKIKNYRQASSRTANRSANSSTTRSARSTSSSAMRIPKRGTRLAGGCLARSTSWRRNCWPRARPIRPSRIHRWDCCRRCGARPAGPATQAGVPEGIAIGDPERVLRACKRWESVGVDRINFLLNAIETVPQEACAQQPAHFCQACDAAFPGFQSTQAAAAGGGR